MIVVFRARNTLRPAFLGALSDPRPTVRIIVPARNEQRDLLGCLTALSNQDYDNYSVTVVNDRSTDETRQIAEVFAAEHEHFGVENITSLPDQWTGKAHAMWQASHDTTADWLCFVDVDVTLEPHAITSAVHEAQQRDVELLTMFPRTARYGFWQQIGVPFIGSLLLIFFDPFRVNSRRMKTGFVNGQFLLIRTERYQSLDGHRSVRDFVIEDVPFGEHAKRNGVPCFVGPGEHLAQVRMYRDCRAMTTGFARILWGALRQPWKMAAAVAILLVALWPLLAGAFLVAHALLQFGVLETAEIRVLATLCLSQLLIAVAFNVNVYRACGLSPVWVLGYPLALVLALLTVCKAWALAGRSVHWRDVQYQVDRAGRIIGLQRESSS